jgi:polyhydroxybutyrate depolymerase
VNSEKGLRLIARLSCLLAAVALIGATMQASAQKRRNASIASAGDVTNTMTIDGIERRYLVRKPVGSASPNAVVLLLHGGGGTAERLIGRESRAAPYRMWNAIADREGLLLVAPQGAKSAKGRGKPGWNDCRNFEDSSQDADDMKFLAALVDKLRRDYRVSGPHNFVVGTSNGGMMALRLAIERPQTFTAVAAVASTMPARSECIEPVRAMPVLMINGTEDSLIPYAGGDIAAQFGGRGAATPVQDSIRVWARLAGGGASPRIVPLPDTDKDDGSRAFREIHATRAGKPYVELIRIDNGGHVEPSRHERYAGFLARLLGRQNGDIEMADEVWAFFAAQK